VTSIDAQNSLAVAGTPQGVKQLRAIVEEWDRPIPQVEIDAKFVSINPAEYEQLGIAGFMNGQYSAEDELKTGVIPADFQQRLDSMIAQGKALIVNNPRATTLHRLTSQLGSRMTVPAQLTVDKDNSALVDFQKQLDALPREAQAQVGVHAFLRVKPTAINGDKVTLELATVQDLQVAESWKPHAARTHRRWDSRPVVTLKSTEQSTVLTIKDGESMLIRGVYPLWMPDSSPTTGNFAVVTVKVLRRAG
jgi:type II secretory pathway component GspD/PulD (secretin)